MDTTQELGLAPDAPLEAVEWRVDSKPFPKDNGHSCRYVPYLDAATIAGLLDQWVGPGRWRDEYQPGDIDRTYVLWCRLSILVDGEWVAKTDVGNKPDMEGSKGAVSDSFKRAACLKWGVGRNVYDLPTLWAPCRVDNAGKAWPNDRTVPSLITQLKNKGFDASGARTAGSGDEHAQPAAQQAKPAPSQPAQAKATDDAPATEGAMARINALGLKGRAVTKLREELIGHGIPWPPNDLTAEQDKALGDVLAAYKEAS